MNIEAIPELMDLKKETFKATEETMQIGHNFVLKNKKVPVKVHKDVPGFIVNRVQDPMDLVAVNANEATKIIAQGACALEDVDTAIMNATGSPFGPMALIKKFEPEDLAKRLEGLAEKFNKEIFRPTQMIKEGAYR